MAEVEQLGFEDLECYQLAQRVLREAYRVAGLLPQQEKYNLADQLRRACTSALLNIAEGYGRYHYLDCLRFFYFARGSLMEVLSGFIACDELKYTSDEIASPRELWHSALRSLNGYIRFVRGRRQGKREYGEHHVREDSTAYTAQVLPSE
ncbi:MAG: four helix bundle protein [Chloroflexota bacterium]